MLIRINEFISIIKQNMPLPKNNVKGYNMLRVILNVALIAASLVPEPLCAQTVQAPPPDSIKYPVSVYQKVTAKPKYPKVVGYLSFILPLETL